MIHGNSGGPSVGPIEHTCHKGYVVGADGRRPCIGRGHTPMTSMSDRRLERLCYIFDCNTLIIDPTCKMSVFNVI